MWWAGSAQDGWGISLVQQAGIVFSVWYTYGRDGKPTWFVATDGTWTGNTFSGALYATSGPSWLGVPYNPSLLTVTPVGNLSLNFSDTNNAAMNYNFTAGSFAGTNQAKSIVRQPY